MSVIRIPDTIDGARAALVDLDNIATATGWHRAAIVFAFVTPDAGNGVARKVGANASALSLRAFAELGIVGLRDKNAVRRYYNAWATAIATGEAVRVAPGDEVEVPGAAFPRLTSEPEAKAAPVEAAPRKLRQGYARSVDADEVRRLRDDDGLTWREIGERLSVADTTAARMYREATGEIPAPKPKRETARRTRDTRQQDFQDACYRVFDAAGAAAFRARRLEPDERQSLFVEHGIGALTKALAVITATRDTMAGDLPAEVAEYLKHIDNP